METVAFSVLLLPLLSACVTLLFLRKHGNVAALLSVATAGGILAFSLYLIFAGGDETFAWVATIDGFQHWIYTHPQHTREERTAAWNTLLDDFSTGVDWSGLENERSAVWHRQLHIFQVPFYYIEYALAQMGAIQLWLNYRTDREACVAAYRHGLSLGGSTGLPELFEAAGLSFDPRGNGFADWVPQIVAEWEKAV